VTDTTTHPAPAGVEDLLALATRVASRARPGEELEVYVSRGVETDVRAYGGEIEQLSSAASAGVGIRVVSAQRQGFAYAGTLEEAAIVETLAEARDNATFATPDEHLGLAVPDTVAPASLDLWDEDLRALPTSAKVELVLNFSRQRRLGCRDVCHEVHDDSVYSAA
jgi:PmbA protein